MTTVLKVKDIKEKLGCGIHRAYDIVKQDDFPKITINNRFYILDDEFEKWLHAYSGKKYEI